MAYLKFKNKDLMLQIGALIQKHRKEAGIRQEDAANYMGLSRTSMVNIEAGNQAISFSSLYRLCELLDCQPGDLMPPVVTNPLPEELEKQLELLPPEKKSAARRALKQVLFSNLNTDPNESN
ncbi:MAG TPA: helix-turn-helix transcriptional regulator [Fibrella sp.]